MITGGGNERLAVEALKLGARDYLVKDVDMGYLSLLPSVIEGVLQQVRLEEEKEQAEEALREYAAQLEARNQELDAFAHTVAHDLKNPLQRVLGFAYLLEADFGPQLDELARECVQAIAQAVDTIASIIEELLLLSSVRQEEVTLESLPMGSVVEAALDHLSPVIEESQARITVPNSWPTALGYGPWIQEVWMNYVSNAIKYGGHPPRVELGATPQADHTVRFWVHDNGQGLTTEEQAGLFTPFTRLRQVKAEGHGLGLSIVRRIMDKLGGGVGVESEVGKGSTFFFTLPRP
jgi:signal transduction histidine kinase